MSTPAGDSFGTGGHAPDSAHEPELAELMRALARAPASYPAPAELAEGEMIGEHLHVQRRLGQGGMGVVYLAHDRRLDRPVAVKLLGGRPRADGITRLEREARAMARLSHPNVAVVHEVGRHLGQPYIAMEYVDGGTARSWLHARLRSWQEIVVLYLQAARGLAAAHAAGFVHRDFKPDNVLVGSDGRARVADFGLVRLLGPEQADAPELPIALAGAPLPVLGDTATDAVMGTLAYMAPEQRQGAEVGPASDQFALCTALDEALGGVLGRAPARAHRARVPRWLRAVLARGTASIPEQRWPSVDALADRLEHGLAGGARRRVALALGGTAIVAAVVGVLLGIRGQRHGCDEGASRIAVTWSPSRRDALAEAFATVGGGRGSFAWSHTAAAIDRWTREWASARDASCRATRVAGTQTERLLTRSMACFADREAELDALLGALAEPLRASVDVATIAASTLPGAAACSDAGYLLARVEAAEPAPPELAALRDIEGLRRAARLDDAEAAATRLRATLGEAALAPDVREVLAELAGDRNALDDARRLAREAYLGARQHEHDELAARAALLLGGLELGHGDDGAALTWIGLARVELERGVADPRLWIPLERAHARALARNGAIDEALVHHERALELARGDPEHALITALVLGEQAAALGDGGRWDEAVARWPVAIAALAGELGEDHPVVVAARRGLALARVELGRFD